MTLPRTPSFRLDGRRALVAGASSGIGLGCAVALAEQGAQVTLAAHSAEKLREAVAAIGAEGLDAEALPLDVGDVGATRAAVTEHGPFDVLVNSAGFARHSPASDTTPEDFDAVSALSLPRRRRPRRGPPRRRLARPPARRRRLRRAPRARHRHHPDDGAAARALPGRARRLDADADPQAGRPVFGQTPEDA